MGEIVYVLVGRVDYEAADVIGAFYSKKSAEKRIEEYLDEEETGGLLHYDGWEISEIIVGEKYFNLEVYRYDEYGREIG